MGRAELSELLSAEGRIEVRCEFCNQGYALDTVDVEQLLADEGVLPQASDQLH
jgi:molecular chaperone Hsp33